MLYGYIYVLIFCALFVVLVLCSGCCPDVNDVIEPIGSLQKEDEKYSVLLSMPAENYIFEKTAEPPIFTWSVQRGIPQTFTIEIDYLGGPPYICGTITGSNGYCLPDEDWVAIKENAPVENGLQKVCWRVKIDYVLYPEDGPYYSAWGSFWIKAS